MIEINLKNQKIKTPIKLEIKKGEFIALVGRSGSGKTTVLRSIAGLEKSLGELKVFGKTWQDDKSFLPPQKRDVGFVFQNYALFENMTVMENLLYVRDDKKLAQHLLEITKIKSFSNRYPKSLSGGQQQRVALCRALMKKPKILLLDEPFSALDKDIRESLQEEVLKLHREFETTTILVSHDEEEVKKMCDRVFSFEDEMIVQKEFEKTYVIDAVVKESKNGKVILEMEQDIKVGQKVSLQLHN